MAHAVFSDVVMDHFLHPRHTQALSAPDGVGLSGSIESSRFMRIQVNVDHTQVTGAAFATYGCAPAIAAGSYLSEWVIGRPIPEVYRLQPAQLLDALGGLPEARRFCATLAIEALRAALDEATRPPADPTSK